MVQKNKQLLHGVSEEEECVFFFSCSIKTEQCLVREARIGVLPLTVAPYRTLGSEKIWICWSEGSLKLLHGSKW